MGRTADNWGGLEHGIGVPVATKPADGWAEPLVGAVLEFVVIGKPEPAGSKRAFRNQHTGRVQVVDANKAAKPWQEVVASAGAQAMSGPLLDGPLGLVLSFFQPRPRAHYGTGRNSGVLKATAATSPTSRPDVLKLARGVEDALTGVCWRDDAQIISEHLYKGYGEPSRVEVQILALGGGA